MPMPPLQRRQQHLVLTMQHGMHLVNQGEEVVVVFSNTNNQTVTAVDLQILDPHRLNKRHNSTRNSRHPLSSFNHSHSHNHRSKIHSSRNSRLPLNRLSNPLPIITRSSNNSK